jgi:CDP-2,3-bis-(O-geranylgeranyl)-sn-glycerol synthase
LEIVLIFLTYLGKVIYTTLPAITANIVPAAVCKIPFLNYPMDFNKTFRGRPILGSHKTFRGLFFGVLSAAIIINLQFLFYKLTGINITIYNPEIINIELLGILMGFGVIAGDAVKSFFKRQFDIPPGKSFIPWDQIDCVLGGLIFGRIAWDFPWDYGITIIVLTFILHIAIRHITYYMGISDSKW